MYEIDCSICDINDYIDKLFSNEYEFKKHFSPPDSGELGEIKEIFYQNLQTLKDVADRSKTLLYEDISLAWEVRDYNEKVIQQLEIKLEQLEHQISQQEANVAAAQRSLASAERAQSKVNATRTPSFPDTEDGRAAKKRFERELANSKASAANAVRSAESSVSNAQSALKNLETSRQNTRMTIRQIEENNRILFDFINKANARIGAIDSYVKRCEFELSNIKSRLEKLNRDFEALRSKFTEYKRRAEKAKDYVHSIGVHLSSAAESQYDESKKISVYSHDYLTDIAASLRNAKKSMDELNDTIDNIVKRFGNIMQDAVTRATVSSVEGCNERVDNETSDFPKKANHFREAADYLYLYTNV